VTTPYNLPSEDRTYAVISPRTTLRSRTIGLSLFAAAFLGHPVSSPNRRYGPARTANLHRLLVTAPEESRGRCPSNPAGRSCGRDLSVVIAAGGTIVTLNRDPPAPGCRVRRLEWRRLTGTTPDLHRHRRCHHCRDRDFEQRQVPVTINSGVSVAGTVSQRPSGWPPVPELVPAWFLYCSQLLAQLRSSPDGTAQFMAGRSGPVWHRVHRHRVSFSTTITRSPRSSLRTFARYQTLEVPIRYRHGSPVPITLRDPCAPTAETYPPGPL